MEDLNLKQLTLAVRTIAEEKNLPEETVIDVIEQAIAAAWRRDNGERDQNMNRQHQGEHPAHFSPTHFLRYEDDTSVARQIARKSSATKAAPPISPPSISG